MPSGGPPCHRARPPCRRGGPRRAGETHRRASCRWGREPSHRSRRSLELGSHAVREGLRTTETGRVVTGRATPSRASATRKKSATLPPVRPPDWGRGVASVGALTSHQWRDAVRDARGAPPGDRLAGGPRDGVGCRRGGEALLRRCCRVIPGRRETKGKIGKHFCWPKRSG